MRRSGRLPSALVVLVALLLQVVALGASTVASAVTRDVEVSGTGASDGRLAVTPAVALLRDVDARTSWPVAVTNGSDTTVTLDLAVTHLEATTQGVAPSAREVAWAALPRPALVLAAGQRADLGLLLRPQVDDLPAAIAFTATPRGDDELAVSSLAVLWPPSHEPAVSLEVGSGSIRVASPGPVVLDLGVLATALPRRSVAQEVGPLVVLGGTDRTIEFEAPRSPFGARTEVVAAVDGTEVARAVVGDRVDLAAASLLALALALLVTAAVTIARARARR